MKQSADQPNILLITCDQLRADYLGAYGADFMKTPNLDRLAREGVRFSNAYSPNPVCIPARHNLITGLPARYHGFDDNYFDGSHVCPWELPTFAQILNDHGGAARHGLRLLLQYERVPADPGGGRVQYVPPGTGLRRS